MQGRGRVFGREDTTQQSAVRYARLATTLERAREKKKKTKISQD